MKDATCELIKNANNALMKAGRALVVSCELNGDVIGCQDCVSIDIRL